MSENRLGKAYCGRLFTLQEIADEFRSNVQRSVETWVNQGWVHVLCNAMVNARQEVPSWTADSVKRGARVRIVDSPNGLLVSLGLGDFREYGASIAYLWWDKAPDYPECYVIPGNRFYDAVPTVASGESLLPVESAVYKLTSQAWEGRVVYFYLPVAP